MKILIGTQNRAKQKDFQRGIQTVAQEKNLVIDLIFPQDINITEDIEEVAETFTENSKQKAKFYHQKSGIPTIADDGGIVIPVLGNNIPGVYSKRWAGEGVSDDEMIAFTLKKLEPYPDPSDRIAMFQVCLTYFDGRRLIQEFGETKGHMALKPLTRITKGFPYRGLFIMPNGKYYDELTPEEHQKYNHRYEAVRKLLNKIAI